MPSWRTIGLRDRHCGRKWRWKRLIELVFLVLIRGLPLGEAPLFFVLRPFGYAPSFAKATEGRPFAKASSFAKASEDKPEGRPFDWFDKLTTGKLRTGVLS